MHLQRIKIRNFRNLAAVELELSPEVNLFYGSNAQGKTALLEAVGYLATSTSHRTRRDEDLIRWNEEAAYVQGVLDGGEEKTLEFGLSREGKQVKVGGAPLKRIGDLYGQLRVVLFVPEDLEIVSGSPSERRRFIDMTLAQVEPEHILHLQKYQQVLKSRNQLLKRAQEKRLDLEELDIWDDQLVQAALPVIESRKQAVLQLAVNLDRFYRRMTDDREQIQFFYWHSFMPDHDQSLKSNLQERLIAARDRDIQQGATSVGPHRDDLQFLLDGKELRSFGSQGQRRTTVLALRLAELEWLRSQTESHPIMLLDDVIYEMDEARRRHFFQEIDRGGQALITATEVEHLGELGGKAKLYRVSAGKVSPE